ncbi:MAG: RluA family pseudouridine synthase [Eubacteriales bacterium]|nr:RluA family pseudouridine synthase [Eubacteriales bacterium]MDD7506858.1 RluA family pseudouridine synthase [Clostridiales bacterium]MDY5726600.1 RluA family pseudouridine synthase [Eubacteriales bacterium]
MSGINLTEPKTQFRSFIVQEENSGDRLDVFVGEVAQSSRSNAQKRIKNGLVTLNGKTEDKVSRTLKIGDNVGITIVAPEPIELIPQNIPLDIVYQDEYLAVINKQQGLTVHPAGGSYKDTLVNALLYHIKDLSGINGDIRPGIVHRLDKDTSGLMVIAKNDFAHVNLSQQIASKECRRIYYALTEGVFKEDSGIIDQPLFRSKTDRKKIAVDPDGRQAITLFNVVERFSANTLVRFELKTGRTHQIRVHSAFIGHPIVGDKVYGFKKQRFDLNGQLLHSKEITFTHPKTGESMHFDSELPDYFRRILSVLKK